ncbi:hypothetical protein BX589_1327 [Paraburkholderia fungorum]|jgi:hypothetical protein|nr:hypothetical protein BX589_1327 [Paraburkholderia fungorum]
MGGKDYPVYGRKDELDHEDIRLLYLESPDGRQRGVTLRPIQGSVGIISRQGSYTEECHLRDVILTVGGIRRKCRRSRVETPH